MGILWCNFANSQECSHIDYNKYKDEFIKCIKSKKKEYQYKALEKSHSFKKFECLNLCKQTVKGTFTIDELNTFCMIQCGLK